MRGYELKIKEILLHYKESFDNKLFIDNIEINDVLMDIFGITQQTKANNKQYWGRELGMIWQNIIIELCKEVCRDRFHEAESFNGDMPFDLRIDNDAIDTKYRVGSGDSGTLKKFKMYANFLYKHNYNPVMLILRNDNLPSAISAIKNAGWQLYTGDDAFIYIKAKTNVDLKDILISYKYQYSIDRNQ